MAIERRERKSQGRRKLYSYRVKWRYNGTGAQQGKTVDNEADAVALEAALRKAGWAHTADDPAVKHLTLIGGTAIPDAVEHVEAPEYVSLYEAVVRWAHRPGLAPGSTRVYMQVAENRLGDYGDVPVNELTLLDLENFSNDQLDRFSETSANTSQAAVMGALRAQGLGKVLEGLNKIDGRRKVTPIFLDLDQVESLVKYAEEREGHNFSVLTEFTAALGPRWGEGVGLQAVHVNVRDTDKAHVWIRQAILNATKSSAGFVPERVKTRSGERLLPVSSKLAKRLGEVVDELPSRSVVFRPHPEQTPDVDYNGGKRSRASFGGNIKAWNSRTFHVRWRALATACPDVPSDLRWHDLRHTAAKNMLERGVPIAYVSKILGHSSVNVTDKEYGSFDARAHDLVRSYMA